MPNPTIGVYANDGNQTVTTREQAAFDFFHLSEGEPDEVPPTTTHRSRRPHPTAATAGTSAQCR